MDILNIAGGVWAGMAAWSTTSFVIGQISQRIAERKFLKQYEKDVAEFSKMLDELDRGAKEVKASKKPKKSVKKAAPAKKAVANSKRTKK